MAVRLVVLLLERALVQLLQTERAHEMFGMEFAEHCGDAPARYRFVAARAQRAPLQVVVGLAIRLALVVEERAADERLSAVLER